MDVTINGAPIYTIPIGPGIQISATIISSWIVMAIITGLCIWLTHDLKVAPFGFGWDVPVSAVLGALAAWLNFFGLAMTLQKVTAAAEEARGRSLMRTSELYRKLGLGLFLIVMMVIPAFNWVAAAIPLLFPQATIFVMYALRRTPSQNKGGET